MSSLGKTNKLDSCNATAAARITSGQAAKNLFICCHAGDQPMMIPIVPHSSRRALIASWPCWQIYLLITDRIDVWNADHESIRAGVRNNLLLLIRQSTD
jgi:hypothetical protein